MDPVKPSDDLSSYLAELLEGSYDCLDRITINAFYPRPSPTSGCRFYGAICPRLMSPSTFKTNDRKMWDRKMEWDGRGMGWQGNGMAGEWEGQANGTLPLN